MENLSQQLLQIIMDNIPQLISAGCLFAGFYMAGIIAKK